MKLKLIKLAFILCQFAFFSSSTKAQYTETFESQIPYANYFNSNGQPFTLTNNFSIFSSRAGYGYQHSNRFIDNIDNIVLNQVNAIKTSDSRPFLIKSLWIYVSEDGGNNPTDNGSLIITGKLAGAVQFTIVKTSGFSKSFVPDNGFRFIDFAVEGGIDNSDINIDEIEFQLQGNFNYIGIDNLTLTPLAVLPLSLISYTSYLEAGGKVKLSWQTTSENNVSQFIISKSNDGRSFREQGNVPAIGNRNGLSNYAFTDNIPSAGINYYRLEELDLAGKIKNLGIRTILIAGSFYKPTIFPNPSAGGSITLRSGIFANTVTTYFISDFAGRILKEGNINSPQQTLDVSGLPSGNYSIVLSNGEVINWIKN